MAKVLISIDEALLRRADRAAKAKKLTRSAFVSQLIARELDGEVGPGARSESRGAMRRLEALFDENAPLGPDSTQIIREMRNSR